MEAERSSFFGRASEIEAILGLLDRTERLVTLVGPAGVGKTLLALRVARSWHAARPDLPALKVDLRGATDAEGAAARVAAAAGAPLVATAAMTSIDQVGLALAERGAALLVLDDLDHLVPIAEEMVGRWLAMAPGLRCLVTSRQALGIHGELRHEVAPLPEEDALALFLARIQAVAPGFVAAGRPLEAAREIVRRLDGLPLAIELAAARSVVLAPEEILGRLDRRLDLLAVDAAHRIGARHSSLRAALEWSWSLLPERGRQALAALSVFDGGASVAAAAAVVGGENDALDELTSLRERSLIAMAGDPLAGESRFSLLDSIRELAAEKLDERGERDAAEARHAAYFLAAGEAWAAAVRGPEGERALRLLRREAANLVRAGRTSLRRAPHASVRIALALGEALALSGPPAVQLAMLDDAVDVDAAIDPALHARALLQRGDARAVCGRRHEGAADLLEAARQARASGDARLEGQALRLLGILRRDDGDFDAAQAHLERAATLLELSGEVGLLGHTVGNLATLYRQRGRAEAARAQYLRALDHHRDAGDRGGQGLALAGLGHLEAAAGSPEAATAHYREALPLLASVDDRRTVAVVHDRLALLALEQGDAGAALPIFEDARAGLAAVGDRRLEAVVAAHHAVALGLARRTSDAATALDAASRVLERIDDARMTATLRLARTWVVAISGDPAAARAALQRASRAADADQRRLAATPGSPPFVEYLTDLCRVLERTLAAEGVPRDEPTGAGGGLEIGRNSAWCSLDGSKPMRLAPLLARMLDALVEWRLTRPGQPLSADELAARMWPDETLTAALASERVYGAVARLRRQGFTSVLVRQAGGYFLHPAVPCVRVDR